jgi:hypothetical protein
MYGNLMLIKNVSAIICYYVVIWNEILVTIIWLTGVTKRDEEIKVRNIHVEMCNDLYT